MDLNSIAAAMGASERSLGYNSYISPSLSLFQGLDMIGLVIIHLFWIFLALAFFGRILGI